MLLPLYTLTLRTSCMHTYIHKYTCIILSLLLYMNRCCANSHVSLPSQTLTLRTSLYTYIDNYTYTYIVSWIVLYMNPYCANSQMFVPLRVLALGTSSYSHVCSQVNIFHITDTLVYDSVLCKFTYVCAIASAHT